MAQAMPDQNSLSETVPAIAPVIITASRFANAPDLAPMGATVITASEIQQSGIDNVNEAIRKIAGVYGRQSMYGTSDFDLDMSGFGTNSSQNMVVLVDGVRLSENELSTPLLSTIPIDSVERIEIMRGGSSVLYGDGATGGVIQIITKSIGKQALSGSVTTTIGQFGDKEVRASLSQGWENFSASVNMTDQQTDNYRNNNALNEKMANANFVWYSDQGRAGLNIDMARQDSRLAGSLTLLQFQQDPRQTVTPTDYASIDTNRYTAFVDRRFGDWEVEAELSNRDKEVAASYSGSSSIYTSNQTQLSPRVRHLISQQGFTNELVVGLDFINWDRDTTASWSLAQASQHSKAVYARDEVKLGQARVAFGVRHEVFDKTSVDLAPYATDNYTVSQGVNAWELQGSYKITPTVDVFAKAGQSFRIANADENGYTVVSNTPINPQTSHDLELGTTIGDTAHQLTARVYSHELKNEIYFDPTANFGYGANTNLDPTKRQGFSMEGKVSLTKEVRVTGQWNYVVAKFTEGVNAGNTMVMVPKNTVSAQLNWMIGNGQTAYVGAQWVDTQRYGGDFSNTCSALIPAYATLDARYAKSIGPWELSVSGTNLTDRHYFSNAYTCSLTSNPSGIYPSDGRQMKISARYHF